MCEDIITNIMCDNSYACFINEVFCVFSSFIILTVIKIYVDAGVQVLCLRVCVCASVRILVIITSCLLREEADSPDCERHSTGMVKLQRVYCAFMFKSVCVCMQKVFVWL